MEIATVTGETRTGGGRHANERLRRRGMIPAVIYGHGEPTETVALSAHEMGLALGKLAHVINLKIGGTEKHFLIKEIQYDHLQRDAIHADLMRVDPNERVKVKIPVEIRGTPAGVLDGGELFVLIADLEVECPLLQIPENVRIRVEQLKIGDSIHVRELALPEGVTPIPGPDDVVCGCRVKRIHEELAATVVAAVEGETPKEPEVLARGKKEEEEAAKE